MSSTSLFNLRGHEAPITALQSCHSNGKNLLLSGDQDGTLIFWDLLLLRPVKKIHGICKSRVQSLRLIDFTSGGLESKKLVAQSRDNGVSLFDLNELLGPDATDPKIIRNLPTCPALFSRGDSKNDLEGRAILAYPSIISGSFVTVRYIDQDFETTRSGSASRSTNPSQNSSTIFDIIIRGNPSSSEENLFVAYEDGIICCFSFSYEKTTTVPELNVMGLKVDLLLKFDTKFGDFVSTFDLTIQRSHYTIICGAPKREILRLTCDMANLTSTTEERFNLRRPGVGTVRITPNNEVFVVAGWDNSVRLHKLNPIEEILSVMHNNTQVHDIIFLHQSLLDADTDLGTTKSDTSCTYVMCIASNDGTIGIHRVDTVLE